MNQFRFAVDSHLADWRWRVVATAEAHFDAVVLLNNNGVAYPNDPFPNRLYVGAKRVVLFTGKGDLQTLSDFHEQHRCHLVGYVGYDLKNQLESLHSRHPDRLGFPDSWFFEPLYILQFERDAVVIQTDEPDAGPWQAWLTEPDGLLPLPVAAGRSEAALGKQPIVEARVNQTDYEAAVRHIRGLIEEGDVYELNYCMEFFAEPITLAPVAAYQALCTRSPMPFSVLLKQGRRYVLGASPERFLKKTGSRLISQPIKGTIRRGNTPAEDKALKDELRNSEKEQAENLMIVDLVRNDLARSAQVGSVRVDELFGIYTFQQLHQMISTVSATARPGVSLADILGNAFPMGSMTGAPKIRAMERIDELEATRRGIYSGAIGYITPDGDFDFNVVIRSLFYNADTHYASFSVGSAITYDADPATEYAECLLKATAMREVIEKG
ncbi:anthranilate synthase component I family protein [Fibrella sp. HMF5335]|uniref:Anthranilate synthase component I family protein n=1 Tax=Fibrella rubiginis TaxID=2817060 RepID=A0A939GCY7_9BACT|nr:anthranilate synthase component I family protein [Fibrella rubiginis]MBO0936061.1 anthranilate synthase component I family protein [Fibrella rubiginis]